MTILAWSYNLVFFALSQVYARIGNSKTDVHFVRMVQVYERITHITCSTPHFNPSGCALRLNVRTGSHVDLLVQYPNYNITRRVIGNQTTIQPPVCPQYGYVYKYTTRHYVCFRTFLYTAFFHYVCVVLYKYSAILYCCRPLSP